jgi:hypothetical protein
MALKKLVLNENRNGLKIMQCAVSLDKYGSRKGNITTPMFCRYKNHSLM